MADFFGDFFDSVSEAMQEADGYYHDGLGWEIAPIMFMDNRTLLCKYYYYDTPRTAEAFLSDLYNCCEYYFEQKDVKPNKIIISERDLNEFEIELPKSNEKYFICLSQKKDDDEYMTFITKESDKKAENLFTELEIEYGTLGSDWPIQLLNTELSSDEEDAESEEESDEDNEDEYADRYDESEDQSDAPNDIDVETYFSSNEKDLGYYTYIRRYKNWVQEIKEYCELFKKKYDVYPNLLIANRITHGRFEDAFNDYYAKGLNEQEVLKKRVELGLEYDGILKEDSDEAGDCYFSTKDYKLRMMENTNFGSGVIKLQRVHGFLSHKEEIEYGTVPKGYDKETKAHPVIDIVATGKHLEKLMKEEGVTPKIFARIMGWEKPQGIYRWYYGETLPSVDTLSVLSRILNRPIETLLIMRNVES